MKKHTFTFLCLLPFFALAQQNFIIKGQLTTPINKQPLVITYPYQNKLITNSIMPQNQTFLFKGSVENEPLRAMLEFGTDILEFYLEPGTINIIVTDSLKNAKITGSKTNEEYQTLKRLLKELELNLGSSAISTNSRFKAYSDYIAAVKAFVTSHPNSFISLEAIDNLLAFADLGTMQKFMGMKVVPKAQTEALYLSINPAIRALPQGQRTGEAFKPKVSRGEVGLIAPNFVQFDSNDNPVKLSDFKGKYLLLDFWASWCAPCREENPNVVAVYKKYNGKNFEVLSISLDQIPQKNAWLTAIKKDGLTWPQAWGLGKNDVASLYGVMGIPANFLIDPTGKIIAKDLKGKKLETQLAALFGEK